MRTTKPLRLGVVARPYRHRRQDWLGVATTMYFRLDTPDVLRSEVAMWRALGERLGPQLAVDAGIPKAGAEIVLPSAHAYPTPTEPTRCTVRAAVGELECALDVVGDRVWKNQVPSAPEPFERMPLGWARAFGGQGFAANPEGRGFTEAYVEGLPLPNVMRPGESIRAWSDRPTPAAWAPVDLMWPQRLGLAGTYDDAWFQDAYPGFPDDIDWHYFSLVVPELRHGDAFAPGAPIVLSGLHPVEAVLRSRLPTHTPRCFVKRHGEAFAEVALRRTTLWLFPEEGDAVLVSHGAMPISEDDARDVEHLLIAADGVDEARPMQHFLDVAARRTDRSLDSLGAATDDQPLLPPGHAGIDPDVDAAIAKMMPSDRRWHRTERAVERNLEVIRSTLREHGFSGDQLPPQRTPASPPTLGEAVARLKEATGGGPPDPDAIAAQLAEGQADARRRYEEAGLDPDEHLAAEGAGAGPPRFDVPEEQAKGRAQAQAVEAAGIDPSFIEAHYTDEVLTERQRAARDAYREHGHRQGPVPEPPARVRAARAEELRRRLAAGEPTREIDFTWADLQHAELAGADLSFTWLEHADLRGADLRAANLEGAMLARARLDGARFDDATLTAANLGAAQVSSARFEGAEMSGAVLDGTALRGCDLRGAVLTGASVSGAAFEGCDLSRAVLSELSLLQCTIAGCTFDEAKLDGVRFMGASLEGSSARGATLDRAVVYDVPADGVDLSLASLVQTTFVGTTSLRGARFDGANLSRALLRGVPMSGASLRSARADEANLGEADLSSAQLDGLRARHADFTRANLSQACLHGADLFEALLTRANLRGADLRRASLYGADLAMIDSDEDTTVEGADQVGVRARPHRRPS